MVITVYTDSRAPEVTGIAAKLSAAFTRAGIRRVALLADDVSAIVRPSGVTLYDLQGGDSSAFPELLGRACRQHEVVVIAPADGRTERAFLALEHADRVLLLSDLTVAGIRGLQRVLRLCASLGYAYDKSHVVLYGDDGGAALSPADAAVALKREIYICLPSPFRNDPKAPSTLETLARRLLAESR